MGRTSEAGIAEQDWRRSLSTGSKRGLCGPKASRNGERHWDGGWLVTASRGVDPDAARHPSTTPKRLETLLIGSSRTTI